MSTEKQKYMIFFVPDSQDGGGAERMTLAYADFARRGNINVAIKVVGRTDVGIRKMVEGRLSVSLIKVRNIWDFGLLKIYRSIKAECPDIVFSSFHYLNSRVIIAALLAGNVRIVVRSENGLQSVNRLTRWLVKKTYFFANVIIAQTDEMRTELMESCSINQKDKVVVLNNPVLADQIEEGVCKAISPYPDGSVNIVSVTRFSRQKGLDILIRAFADVHRHYPEIKLNIVGGYTECDTVKKEMDEIILEYKLQNNIIFWGFQANPYPYEKYADCFVLSSRWEGLPNALIEAQFLRVPSVSTACIPSIARIIKEGKTGYIVPVNDPKALAGAIVKALKLKNIPFVYEGATVADFCNLL